MLNTPNVWDGLKGGGDHPGNPRVIPESFLQSSTFEGGSLLKDEVKSSLIETVEEGGYKASRVAVKTV